MSNELTVQYSTPSIQSNFDRLDSEIEAKLEIYRNVEIDIEDEAAVKSAKNDAAYLNSLIKDIDDRRKAVKREYEAPLKAFEAQCKQITDKIQTCRNDIKVQLDEAESIRKGKRQEALEQLYMDFAPALVPVVPFERILETSWLNKSTPIKKAEDELTSKVEQIANDWETLKSLNLENQKENEFVFFSTLSLQRTIEYANKRIEQQKRIDELRALVDPTEQIELEEVFPYVMEIEAATPEQVKQIGAFCKSIGVHGTLKKGRYSECI